MAKVPTKEKKPYEPEILPDAWERLRTAVHVRAKAGPQHREPKPAKQNSHHVNKKKTKG
jgi:hypothetical protein